ncbi:MAG TPA: hypothetical protein PLD62_01730 [Candidatus Cloacimonadota bacterium]|nr:hypothetical protein [Candidatus Cloacimonadota bacterium]
MSNANILFAQNLEKASISPAVAGFMSAFSMVVIRSAKPGKGLSAEGMFRREEQSYKPFQGDRDGKREILGSFSKDLQRKESIRKKEGKPRSGGYDERSSFDHSNIGS